MNKNNVETAFDSASLGHRLRAKLGVILEGYPVKMEFLEKQTS